MKYPTTIKTLIDKLRDGDSLSWEEFYDRYNGIIRDLGNAKGLTLDECDDLVQEVMLRFFHTSKTFQFEPDIARFRTYFGRIVEGKIIDILRKRMNTKASLSMEEERSLELKASLCDKYQLAGIACWKLGLDPEYIWDVIDQ